ncbi:MAG: flavin reductase family protein [Desulfobacterales bacterium]|jgi:flavin reductase (DIM6/NTAB) family NADH-FMN oxidoreductase RutF
MKKSIGAKTIIQPNPVLIIGSYDEIGNPNIMAVAWGGICCSQPPCASIALRKATHTYGNILNSKAFSINIPSILFVKEADYVGIYSGKHEDKFESLGLTPVRSDVVNAPYIEEFPLVLECEVLKIVEIGLHTQFIGEIKDVKADESILGENGLPDIEKVKPFIYDHVGSRYYALGEFLGKAYSVGRKK